MREKVEALQKEIEDGVASLVDGEDWRRWLQVAARFPRYSFRNTLLVRRQCPDASVVMGYRAWQALGHQVRKGERSITILAPVTYRRAVAGDQGDIDTDPVDEQRGSGGRVLRGFRLAHVFDISQTDGDTVRPPARPVLLEGEAPAGLWDALAAQVQAQGFELVRAALPEGVNGSTDFATRTVAIAPQLSDAQAAKTLAHELGHVLLHDGTEYASGCRGRAEVEAESVAYVVCQAAGLVTSGYSFGYVARWSGGDTTLVKTTAERVVTCARRILERSAPLAPADNVEATAA